MEPEIQREMDMILGPLYVRKQQKKQLDRIILLVKISIIIFSLTFAAFGQKFF